MVSSVGSTDIVNALGSGSGMDIKSLAANLTNAAKAPQQAIIDTQKTALTAKVSSVGKILSTVSSFASSITQLGDPNTFQRSPTSSDPSKVTMAFTGKSAPSTFSGNVQVNSLSTASKALFPPMTSLNTSLLGTDAGKSFNLSWTNGAGATQKTSIDLAKFNTLPTLRDEINKITGFSATILKGGTVAAPQYYLSVQHGSGASSAFTSTVTVNDSIGRPLLDGAGQPMLASTGFTANAIDGYQTVAGTDASITIDGVPVTSATNNFDSVLPGVSITAVAPTGGSSVALGSQVNGDGLTNAMATLVSGFNTMITNIKAETVYDPNPAKKGGLANESSASRLLDELRRFTTQSITGYDGKSHTLAELGVATNKDGTLTVDNVAFAKVLRATPEVAEAVLASKRSIDDSRLSLNSVSKTAQPGLYTIAKKDASTWTINGEAATLANGLLTAGKGTKADGIVITLPSNVSGSAVVGYSTNLNFSKGLVERFTDMLANVQSSSSPLQSASKNATTQLDAIAIKQSDLDDKMTKIQQNYVTQFASMQAILNGNQSTQTSLTSFMTAWTNGLKA
jgi:flagellar hook-associated protein 2